MNVDLEQQAVQQQALLPEARRRLEVRRLIDEKRHIALRQAQRERLENATSFESEHKGEPTMTKLERPSILSRRLPTSGNAALSASALIQAALGVEFTLSGLNKLADPH